MILEILGIAKEIFITVVGVILGFSSILIFYIVVLWIVGFVGIYVFDYKIKGDRK